MIKCHGSFYIIMVKSAQTFTFLIERALEGKMRGLGSILVLTVTHCVRSRGYDLPGLLTSEMREF